VPYTGCSWNRRHVLDTCSMYQNKEGISYRLVVWGLCSSLWQLHTSTLMKVVHISLAGDTFSGMMNCFCQFQIYTVYTQTFLIWYSDCPRCTLAHIAPLFITDHTQQQSTLEHMFICCSSFMYPKYGHFFFRIILYIEPSFAKFETITLIYAQIFNVEFDGNHEIWDYYTYLCTNLQHGVWWKSWNLRLLHLFMHKSSTWSLMEIISESVRVESGIAKKHPVFNF